MRILDKLNDDSAWDDFLYNRLEKNNLPDQEEKDLMRFIVHREYLPIVNMINQKLPFPNPEIKEINKNGVSKKRIVFSFPREYNYVLKMISYLLLQSYDNLFESNLYSFRNNTGVRKAL